jgi:hypothetical protein
MRTIIAGSRSITSGLSLLDAISGARRDGIVPTVVVCGCAKGVDTLGEQWARMTGLPVERYPAQWRLYGRSAGFMRNVQMAVRADALIALWDGKSPGTRHMIARARRRGLRVYVHRTDLPELTA